MDYWHKQNAEKPLFPDLIWSRPEHTSHAGKLLIVGGNSHGFAEPAEAFAEAFHAGAGSVRIVLPDAVRKTAGAILPELEYAPSTPSGSFAQSAAGELLNLAAWSDGTLLAGNFGQNSETAIVVETFAAKYQGLLTVAKDAADILISSTALLTTPDRLYVVTMSQLQRLAMRLHVHEPMTSQIDLLQLIERLHNLTEQHPIAVITKHVDQLMVAVNGQVSTTKLSPKNKWTVRTATHAATWWLQNPSKPFEALTTAIYELTQ